MRSSSLAVASSPSEEHEAISPAPASTAASSNAVGEARFTLLVMVTEARGDDTAVVAALAAPVGAVERLVAVAPRKVAVTTAVSGVGRLGSSSDRAPNEH